MKIYQNRVVVDINHKRKTPVLISNPDRRTVQPDSLNKDIHTLVQGITTLIAFAHITNIEGMQTLRDEVVETLDNALNNAKKKIEEGKLNPVASETKPIPTETSDTLTDDVSDSNTEDSNS